MDKNKKHNIEVVVDRLSVKKDNQSRMVQSIETALTESNGLVEFLSVDENSEILTFSTKMACPVAVIVFPNLSRGYFLSIVQRELVSLVMVWVLKQK